MGIIGTFFSFQVIEKKVFKFNFRIRVVKVEENFTNEMHHLFAMACHDNSPMRLNFKGNSTEPCAETKIPQPKLAANGESLISSPRKYNVSSLR